jgi:hypothetical protein
MKRKFMAYKVCSIHFSTVVLFPNSDKDCPLCIASKTIERFIETFGELEEGNDGKPKQDQG